MYPFERGLPKAFWGEDVVTAAYLINLFPFSGINMKTPMEIWKGHIVKYKHLRNYGCQAYAHVKQDKLDPRPLKCCFIGYPNGVKGYKLWNLESKGLRCFVSRGVTFDKTKFTNS